MIKSAIRTEDYADWLKSLDDARAAAKITVRVDRLRLGNPGDTKAVGGGVWELRIDYGPGYRVYYSEQGKTVVILLAGGTKKSQTRDIEEAKRLLAEWKGK
jgi:putative addiction module killer protein